MRLLLYNIRYGAGIGKKFHFPLPYIGYLKKTNGNFKKISDFIKAAKPDITALIEVDSGSFRTERSNQAGVIADEMRQSHVCKSKYCSSSIVRKFPVLNKQCNALLTNQKIISKKFHYLNNGVKRLVIELELDDVSIFLVHLSLKYRHRQSQLKDLYTLVGHVKKPVIVAGDFNVFHGDDELQLFLAATGLRSANCKSVPSHPSRFPKRQLDFILHSAGIHPTGFQIPHVKFSDHVPLIYDFEIRPESVKQSMAA